MISLKKQKVIKYIPIIQFITLFCWGGYYRKNNLKYRDYFKTFMKMVVFLLVINIPRMILHFVFNSDSLDIIIFYISIYPCFLGLATIAVADQEHHEDAIKSNVSAGA
ncbi:MAG: hypothetical protein IJZ83_06115 [Clostridia bacterium]|nr:hypothetical protein [Clostridia bacterium]